MYWTTLEISAPRCALMCYPSRNITYCIACLLCIGVILLNKFNSIWRSGADLSAPQQIVVGEPTGRLSGVREQTCRLPSISALGARQVGSPENRRWGPDMSAPQTLPL